MLPTMTKANPKISKESISKAGLTKTKATIGKKIYDKSQETAIT